MLNKETIFCKKHHVSPDYVVEREHCLECIKDQIKDQAAVIESAEKVLNYLSDQDWIKEPLHIQLPINKACDVLLEIKALKEKYGQ